MRNTSFIVVSLFALAACTQAVPHISSSVTVESSTSTNSVEVFTPTPRHTLSPIPALYSTPTEWIKVYPTKKALLIYSTSFRSEYTLHFIEWGDFYPTPHLILYEDGQLIFGIGASEKQLSQADTQAIISKLEQMGILQLYEAYEANPDSVFTLPPDMDYNPLSYTIEITFDKHGPKTITYQQYWEEHLVQSMKEIVSYLNSFSSIGATPYLPDRLLVSVGDATDVPENEIISPWPEDVTPPLHRSYMGVLYLEGNEASEFYQAVGESLFGYFSYEGKNYEVKLRPILPHECHIYHLYEDNPPAQPYFTCDNW
jgi:uncharacterized protein YcfL